MYQIYSFCIQRIEQLLGDTLSGLITGWIPVIGAIVGLVLKLAGALVDVYVVAGIVIQVLVYTKVIKE